LLPNINLAERLLKKKEEHQASNGGLKPPDRIKVNGMSIAKSGGTLVLDMDSDG
jgi:hypothetical protein